MSLRYRAAAERFVRLNLITTITGATAGADGTSETITSRTDRFVLGAIRRSSDVVVVGARTVRVEGYLLPKTARLAVVTATGDLGSGGLSAAGRSDRPPALVLCPQARVDDVRRTLGDAPAEVMPVASDADRLRPGAIISALHERGFGRIVCEGGPALASAAARRRRGRRDLRHGLTRAGAVAASVRQPVGPSRRDRRRHARRRRGIQLPAAASAALRPRSLTHERMLSLHRSWS